MARHAPAWASVGAAKLSRNHVAVAGEKLSRMSAMSGSACHRPPTGQRCRRSITRSIFVSSEPTFVSIDDFESAEWNTAAVGPQKRALADTLIRKLRDRFAPDFWRIASRQPPEIPSSRGAVMQRGVWELLERFSALSGLIAEDMVRSPAWRFLDMGRRIERALAICRMLRQMDRADDEADALSAMLDLCDSQISYRSRYLSSPARAPVLDLLLLDPENPRSLIFQLQALNDHIEALPTLADNGLPEAPQLASRAILANFAGMSADTLDDALLLDTEERLLALSEAVSLRYFLQFDRAKPVGGQFLA